MLMHDNIPYLLLFLIVLFMTSFFYICRNRDEVLRSMGIDVPKNDKIKKKFKNRLAKKNNFKYSLDKKVNNNSKEVVKEENKAKVNKTANQPKLITGRGKSDFTIETDSPIVASSLDSKGFIIYVEKNKKVTIMCPFLYDIGEQDFRKAINISEPSQITNIGFVPSANRLFYTTKNSLKHCKLNFIDDKYESSDEKVMDGICSNSIDFICTSSAPFLAMAVDKNVFKVIDAEEQVVYTETYDGGIITSMTCEKDMKYIFLSVNTNNKCIINIYSFNTKKRILKLYSSYTNNVTVSSLSYNEYLGQLMFISGNKNIVLLKSKLSKPTIEDEWELESPKMIASCRNYPVFAIVCKNSRVVIITKDGNIMRDEPDSHAGKITNIVWSYDDKWLYMISDQKPDIESYINFRFIADKAKI